MRIARTSDGSGRATRSDFTCVRHTEAQRHSVRFVLSPVACRIAAPSEHDDSRPDSERSDSSPRVRSARSVSYRAGTVGACLYEAACQVTRLIATSQVHLHTRPVSARHPSTSYGVRARPGTFTIPLPPARKLSPSRGAYQRGLSSFYSRSLWRFSASASYGLRMEEQRPLRSGSHVRPRHAHALAPPA